MDKRVIPKSIITFVVFFLINFGLWEVLVDNGMNESWASFTVYAILIVTVILVWNKTLINEWGRFKCGMKSYGRFSIELLIYLAVAVALSYLLQYLVNGSFATENTETVSQMVNTIPPALSIIMMTIFTPFIEELTFRESMIGFINKENKTAIFVMAIMSIIIFDCIHLFRWQEFFYYLPISIALTVFYVKHDRNIYSSIIMHALANLPGAVMMVMGML